MGLLSETAWDVVIVGTGLQQSLFALALSRSDKKILHVDPNQFYGGPEAAFSLEEADDWVRKHEQCAAPSGASSTSPRSPFTFASVTRPPQDVAAPGGATGSGSSGCLSSPRAYSLALAPQVIHARSRLVSQLVSSRAFRQLEFLAVGSFFVLKPTTSSPAPSPTLSSASPSHTLNRIPSTREDVFSDGSIHARAKRSLMKFLKFVLEYDSPPHADLWQSRPDRPLAEFLGDKFNLDADLRSYVLALTMAPDYAKLTTGDGLAAINRHLTSMGVFGPGFAALYPKWGGAGEIAQVACRAGAVGGGVYMLGTGVKSVGHPDPSAEASGAEKGGVVVELSDGTNVTTNLIVRSWEEADPDSQVEREMESGDDQGSLSRMIAVVGSPLSTLFENVVEGSPKPAVAIIACPPGSLGQQQPHPVYVLVHSSDTGECPSGQTVLYFSTLATADSKALLEQTLNSVLAATSSSRAGSAGAKDITDPSSAHPQQPPCLYRLHYVQARPGGDSTAAQTGFDKGRKVFTFPAPSASLVFEDHTLDHVQEAWKLVVGSAADEGEYMKFADREGMGSEDDDLDY